MNRVNRNSFKFILDKFEKAQQLPGKIKNEALKIQLDWEEIREESI